MSDALNGRYVYIRIWSIERDVEFEINLPKYAGVSKKSAQMYLRPDLRGTNYLKEARFFIDVSDYDVLESVEIQFSVIKSGKIEAQSSIHCDRVDIDMAIYRRSANAPKSVTNPVNHSSAPDVYLMASDVYLIRLKKVHKTYGMCDRIG